MSLQGAAGKLWHCRAGAEGAQAPDQGWSVPGPGPRWDEHHALSWAPPGVPGQGSVAQGEQDSTHPEPAPGPRARAAPQPLLRARPQGRAPPTHVQGSEEGELQQSPCKALAQGQHEGGLLPKELLGGPAQALVQPAVALRKVWRLPRRLQELLHLREQRQG